MIRDNSGLTFDGGTVKISIGRAVDVPCISEKHGDSVKAEWVYRLGMQIPEDDTPGIYEPSEGELKMTSKNFRLLMARCPKLGIANVKRIAVVTMSHPDIGHDSDALVGFRLMGAEQALEASAKAIEVTVKCRYRLVQWTSARKMFGNPRGAGTVGTIRI